MVEKGGETQATAGYIITLYREVENLTQLVADYIDFYVQLDSKYGSASEAKMTEEEQKTLRTLVYAIRSSIFNVHVKMKALASKIDAFDKATKKLSSTVQKLLKEPVFEIRELQKYVEDVNAYFVEGVSYDVLEKLSDIYSSFVSAYSVGAGAGGGEGGEIET